MEKSFISSGQHGQKPCSEFTSGDGMTAREDSAHILPLNPCAQNENDWAHSMRSLAQTKVLTGAGLAAVLSSLACYPRLALWSAQPSPLPFLWLMLLWATFVLWSFVLGWHSKYTGQRVLAFRWQPRLWIIATLCALAAAVVMRLAIDPQLRATTPGDYPTNWQSWTAMSLFTLAFDPLFLCFAPFAFFIRLFHRQTSASVLTVIFGLFILYLKVNASTPPPPWLLVEMIMLRVAAGFLCVYFYLKGGAWLIWWVLLLAQLRHLLPYAA
jgi:hypothetical protein